MAAGHDQSRRARPLSPETSRSSNIGGIAVHTAARAMAKAEADEILVSSTVRDLVAGSDLEISERCDFKLKGLPGTWRLWAPAA